MLINYYNANIKITIHSWTLLLYFDYNGGLAEVV